MSSVNDLKIEISGASFHLSKQDFEEAKKGIRKPQVDAEGKAIEMDMTVDASAEYTTNAKEYFRKAMIGENRSRSKFRSLLGVKDRVKLGGVTTSATAIKAGATAFDPDNTTAVQKTYEVKPLMYGTTVNINELEQAFMSDQLARGSNNFSDKFEFMNFFYSELESEVEEQMEEITYTGTVAANGVDGLETLLAADGSVLVPTVGNGGVASAVTDANVIDKLKQARNVLPKAVRKKTDFVYLVSTNVYDALMDAISENKASGLYYLEGQALKFQGIEVYEAEGASDDTIIATYWSNLLNIQDLMDEELGFNIVDFMKTTLDRKIGVRVDFKFQPSYVNSEEVYAHLFTA
jgi:hypothetical protein